MTTTVESADPLRELLSAAAAAGVSAVTVRRASVTVTDLRTEIMELKRMADPRKLKTADLQARLIAAHAAMLRAGTEHPVDALAERFDLSKKTVWRHLHKARHTGIFSASSACRLESPA